MNKTNYINHDGVKEENIYVGMIVESTQYSIHYTT